MSGSGVFRVLLAGCGGWCEPISVACALRAGTAGLDGAAEARRIEIDAIDRNPHVLNGEPRFAGLEVRSGVPEWAERWFDRDDAGLIPKREVCAVVRPRVIDVVAMIEECVAHRARYDAILFRNVAIYLDDQTRVRIFRGFAEILAEDGVLLVGHSETFAAAEATGFAPLSAAGAFALSAKRTEGTATERAAHDPSNVQTRVVKSPARVLPRPAGATVHEPTREPVRKPEFVQEQLTPASYISRARELEASGDLLGAWQVIGKALYLDRTHEEALVLGAQLAEKRGDAAEAERLRMRALRVHLANESMRDRRA
jgi:hypothetical protein